MSSYTDVSAWICYLVIAVIGSVVSFYHVNSKLYGAKILWLRIELWVVYLLYILFPVTLFWLLDASGEVKDTSLLWAALIALVYRKILSGNTEQVKAPDILSGYWVSLENLIEKLIENWGDSVHKFNQWQHRAIQRRLSAVDRAKLINLLEFSKRLEISVPEGIAQAASTQGDIDRQAMSALSEKVYMAAMKEYRNDIPNIFVEEKVLTTLEVFLHCKFQLRQILTTLSFTAILAGSAFLLFKVTSSESFNPELDYYVWRIGKSNTSEKDVHRNSRAIVNLMKSEALSGNKKEYLLSRLLGKLYSVDISTDRAKKITHLLAELKEEVPNQGEFISNLADILRSERFEIRVIVQSNLLFFAHAFDKTLPPELTNADVSKDLKTAETENIISLWNSI